MKKVYAFILLAFCSVFAVLAGCAPDNYRGLKFGKYYLENSDDVYIEIKADHQAFLNNLEFSDFDAEAVWGGSADWVEGYITVDEVIIAMQGEKEYWYFDKSENEPGLVCFEVKAKGPIVFQIPFEYNGSNELKLTGHNEVYILRK